MRFCISISGLVCLSICPIKWRELSIPEEMSKYEEVLSFIFIASPYVTMACDDGRITKKKTKKNASLLYDLQW